MKFKVNDKVYCPALGTGIYSVKSSCGMFFVGSLDSENIISFNEDGVDGPKTKRGRQFEGVRVVWHANERNRKLLSTLHSKKFTERKCKRRLLEIQLKRYGWSLIKIAGKKLRYVDDIDKVQFGLYGFEVIDHITGKVIVDIDSKTSDVHYLNGT